MRNFVKIKSSRNGKITLSFTVEVNHVIVANFYIANMSFNTFRENKILANISEFTVSTVMFVKIFQSSFSDSSETV